MKIHTKALLIFAVAMVVLMTVVFLLSNEITLGAYRAIEIAQMERRAARLAEALRSGQLTSEEVRSVAQDDLIEHVSPPAFPADTNWQVEITGPETITATVRAGGSADHPAKTVRLTHRRTPAETGRQATRIFTIAFAIAGGVLFLLVFFGLDRAVLSPIRKLQRGVAAAAATRGGSNLGGGGGDEISLLAAEIDDLTQSLRASEEQHRQLSNRLLTARDQERRRIARDLHDSTAQVLTGIQMNLSMLTTIERDDNLQAERILQQTRDLANQCSGELRTLSHLLHPPLLDEIGLVFAARLFVDGFTKRSGTPVDMDVPSSLPRLSADVETALFRIVQESLSNVHRHSEASRARLLIEREDDGISVVIADNGIGVPGQPLQTPTRDGLTLGVGLLGMQERIAQFSGTLRVTGDSTGTTVRAFIPWEWKENPPD